MSKKNSHSIWNRIWTTKQRAKDAEKPRAKGAGVAFPKMSKKKKKLNRLRLDMRGKQGIAEEAGRESRHGVGLGTSCAY